MTEQIAIEGQNELPLNSGKPLRQSNLELYRIIVMLLIIAHHYFVNSGMYDAVMADGMTFRAIFTLYLGAWGKTGINCFVLITGYFMCKQKITLKKFLKLILEVKFYEFIIYFIFLIAGYEAIDGKRILLLLLPIREGFATNFTECFLLFFLCIPFLNILIKNLTEKQHLLLIALTLFICTVLGTMRLVGVAINYVVWFCVLYFISSFVRLYPKKIFDNKMLWGGVL